MSNRKQGGNTGSVDWSPLRRRRAAARRQAEDRRWAARSGLVSVRRVDAIDLPACPCGRPSVLGLTVWRPLQHAALTGMIGTDYCSLECQVRGAR